MCPHCWNANRLVRRTTSEDNVTTKKTSDGTHGLFVTEFRGRKHPLCSVDKPLMVAIDTAHLSDVCYCCLGQKSNFALLPRSGKNLDEEGMGQMRRCPDCKVVSFCDAACQKQANDDFHEWECPIFQAVYPKVMPNHLRAVLRVLLIRRQSNYSEATWNRLKDVQSKVDLFRKAGGKRWEDLCNMAQCAMEYSDTKEKFVTVIGLFCSFLTNAFPIKNDLHDPIGIALDPLFAPVRHSCHPNTVIRNARLHPHSNKGIWLQPLQAIGDNEEITISYVDPTLPTSIRHRILKEDYFLNCCCSSCIEVLEGEEAIPVPWLSNKTLVAYAEASSLIQAAAVDTTISGPIEKLRYAIHILLRDSWPLSSHPFPLVIERLVSAYMDDLQVNLALAYASLLYFRIDQETYDGMASHPVAMAHTYQLIRLIMSVTEAKYWEAQKLDLVPRKLDLVYVAKYLLRKLQRAASNVSSDAITDRLYAMDTIMTAIYRPFSVADLKDEGKQKTAANSLNQLGLDVLQNLQAWRGEITA